ALATYSGALVIVDAHGFHPDRGPGKLLFGGHAANPLEGITTLNVPPIVFLAACDTHATDRGQETVAMSFVMAGARTVVGTLGPVGSLESAVLLSHLLMSVRELPSIYPGPIRWSELFWMVSCAEHAGQTATILRNERSLPLTPNDVQEIHTAALTALTTF